MGPTRLVMKALADGDRSADMGAANYLLFTTGPGGLSERSVMRDDIRQIKPKDTGPWPGMMGQLPTARPPKPRPTSADLGPEDSQPFHPFRINWCRHSTDCTPLVS